MSRKIFGVEFVDFFHIPLERRIQTLAVLQWIFTFLFLGLVCFAFFFFLLFTPLFFLVLAYIPWYIYDFRTPERGGRRIEWIRRSTVWRYFRDYFPISLVKTAELSPERNYILVYHPHGVFVNGAFCNFGTEATGFSSMFPGIRTTLLSLKYQFLFPINREYVMSLGVVECSKRSMDWLLTRQGKGNAIVLVVGGASEALEARPGSTTLTLARRKGFARVALEHGVPLVPVYGFGETEVYNQVSNPPGSRLRRFQMAMMKYLTFSPPLFHGRGVFNYTFGWMPFRRPINVVVGRPLEVEMRKDASEQEVDALHQKYIAALNDLFETHKANYGIEESCHLNIV